MRLLVTCSRTFAKLQSKEGLNGAGRSISKAATHTAVEFLPLHMGLSSWHGGWHPLEQVIPKNEAEASESLMT